MDWKKSLFTVTILGMAVSTMAGCSGTTETAPATSPTPAATSPIAGARPTPPTDNGTMPAPPQGLPGERTSAPALDYATAAAKLGVTEQQLRDALAEVTQGPPDFAAAAQQLGITEQALTEALGMPDGAPPTPAQKQ